MFKVDERLARKIVYTQKVKTSSDEFSEVITTTNRSHKYSYYM
jgi:hypothetical protein